MRVVKVYDFYDKPLSFSCVDGMGKYFFALLIGETDSTEQWLYLPVSDAHRLTIATKDGSTVECKEIPCAEALDMVFAREGD